MLVMNMNGEMVRISRAGGRRSIDVEGGEERRRKKKNKKYYGSVTTVINNRWKPRSTLWTRGHVVVSIHVYIIPVPIYSGMVYRYLKYHTESRINV